MTEALVLIDIQTGFDHRGLLGHAQQSRAPKVNAARLLTAWRGASLPICHIRHVSTEPGSPLGPETGGTEFNPLVAPLPDEAIFEKSVNSAFIGTGLETPSAGRRCDCLGDLRPDHPALRIHHHAHGRQSGVRRRTGP